MFKKLNRFLQRLRDGADAAIASERHLAQLLRLKLWEEVKTSPRFLDPKRLLCHGFKAYSQSVEDGMIAEVFRRIGTSSKRFIEFGVEDGRECNSILLLLSGWTGAWIDGSKSNVESAQQLYCDYPIEVLNEFVTIENADALMTRLAAGKEPDLLSIDIDSNDYWVWDAITSIHPRLVIVEYNATLPPSLRKSVAHDPNLHWNGTNYFGASLGALQALGEKKGYSLVGCSPAGVNAFFVRNDLVGSNFCEPFTAENHYEPPRYELAGPAGHRSGMGRWVDV
jgi:hypothetical protein